MFLPPSTFGTWCWSATTPAASSRNWSRCTIPSGIGALVLTSCDAFEHFPPPILKPVILAAKSKTMFRRRDPGHAGTGRAHDARSTVWRTATSTISRRSGCVRRCRIRRSPKTCASSRCRCAPRSPPAVAARLPEFDKPTLIAWSADDVFFEQEDGRRLAATDSQRPTGSHRGSADLLDGGPARPARRSALDGRGARVTSSAVHVTTPNGNAALGRRILVTGGATGIGAAAVAVAHRRREPRSPPPITGRRRRRSRRDLAAVRCARRRMPSRGWCDTWPMTSVGSTSW